LANEICQSCHKSSKDMPQPVSKCIKSSTTKSINEAEIYHKIMLYPSTKNLPKIKKLCNQQQPKAKNIKHINFYNNATNYVLPQKKPATHAIKAQNPEKVSKCIKSATNYN